MKETGIDVDEAQYGRIIPAWMHQLISYWEDKDWNEWKTTHPHPQKEEVLAEAKLLDEKYHTNWLYAPTFPYTKSTTKKLEEERDRNGGYFRPPP